MYRLFIYILIFSINFYFSCKNEREGKEQDTESIQDQEVQQMNTNIQPIFDPCNLVNESKLAEIFNVPAEAIAIKSDQYSSEFSRSCNIKWNSGDEMKGLMLLIQTNPLPDELDGWADLYLNTKREDGEKSVPEDENAIKYRKFNSIKENSAYNSDIMRLYWKINDDKIFAVFLSDNFPSKKAEEYFLQLYKVINENEELK